MPCLQHPRCHTGAFRGHKTIQPPQSQAQHPCSSLSSSSSSRSLSSSGSTSRGDFRSSWSDEPKKSTGAGRAACAVPSPAKAAKGGTFPRGSKPPKAAIGGTPRSGRPLASTGSHPSESPSKPSSLEAGARLAKPRAARAGCCSGRAPGAPRGPRSPKPAKKFRGDSGGAWLRGDGWGSGSLRARSVGEVGPRSALGERELALPLGDGTSVGAESSWVLYVSFQQLVSCGGKLGSTIFDSSRTWKTVGEPAHRHIQFNQQFSLARNQSNHPSPRLCGCSSKGPLPSIGLGKPCCQTLDS